MVEVKGKLKFVRQGLMGRLVSKRIWIIEKSKIRSIKFIEIDVTFFKVECTGDAQAVRDSLNLIKREALCIGGFEPVKELYPPSQADQPVPPSVGKLQFVRHGLMARLIGKKDWIKEEGGIESIWFQELNARYFTVTCAGNPEKVKESLKLIKWKALSIGGFVPGIS